MKKKQLFGCVVIMLCSQISVAMQPLDDQSLSATTGQDGISIGFHVSKVELKQASLIDSDGLASGNFKGRASLVIAGQSNTPISMNVLGANNGATVLANIDSSGGAGKPYTNIGIGFSQTISGIEISPFSIYTASTMSTSDITTSKSIFATADTLNSDVKKILDIGTQSNKFEIAFHSINKPGVNIQLGNIPQSHMFAFSGAIQSVCGTGTGCPIRIVSDATAASFNFQLKANNTSTGFALSQFHAGVEKDAVVFGNYGVNTSDKVTSDKLNIALNNVVLGDAGASNPTVFNGLKNGLLGNIGAVGTSVTNLKVKISGL